MWDIDKGRGNVTADPTARVFTRRKREERIEAGSRTPFLLARVIEHVEHVNGLKWTKPNEKSGRDRGRKSSGMC